MAEHEGFLEVRSVAAGDPPVLECRPTDHEGQTHAEFAWIPLDKGLAREGLAVALTALSAGKRMTGTIVNNGGVRRLTALRIVA